MSSCATTDSGSSGHGSHPPRSSPEGSSNVFVNSSGVHRNGDAWPAHTSGDNTHTSNSSGGSSTVFVNSSACNRIGDPAGCGGVVTSGSGNVFVG